MNHPPEKQSGDADLPLPGESVSVAPPPAVDINAEHETKQSISSPDSDSEEEDFFRLEPAELGGPSLKPPTTSTSTFVDNEISQSAKYPSRKPPQPARYDVPDPNRIPMSVFARNTATTSPKEWSVASNESLFSIQLGNSSFSREQGMLLIGRSEELGNFASGPPRPPPARGTVEGKAKLVDVNEVKEAEVDDEATTEKEEIAGYPIVDSVSITGYPMVDSVSTRSDCSSTTSFGSFAFPVLFREGKCESIKVIPKNCAEQQHPTPVINLLNAQTTKKKCFSCFSWRHFCF